MDLLPPIAAGNLESWSVAELMASAFVANATGTLVIEQGRLESRLFLRYGVPCGAQLAEGNISFGAWLRQEGVLDQETYQRTRTVAQSRNELHGDVLVQEGILTQEELDRLLTTQHTRNLFILCLLRQGRYELRGWERPPAWTGGITVDPLRVLLDALHADELRDRRRALAEAVGRSKVRLTTDWQEQLDRLDAAPDEKRALATLVVPRNLTEIGGGLFDRDASEALGCATLLLGVLEVDDGSPRAYTAPQPPAEPELDAEDLLRPLAETPPPVSGATLENLIRDYARSASATAVSRTVEEIAWPDPPSLESDEPHEPAPVAAERLSFVTDEFVPGELELNASGESLELDLDRAPKQFRIGVMEEQLRAADVARAATRPRLTRPALEPPLTAPAPAPTVTATLRRPKPASDYNPFNVHFKAPEPPPPPAPPKRRAPQPQTLEHDLDARFDRVLNEGLSSDPADLFEGLEEELVEELATPGPTQPLAFGSEESANRGDDLALVAVREALAGEEQALLEDEPVFESEAEPAFEPEPQAEASEEIDIEAEEPEATQAPLPEPSPEEQARRDAMRKRLLNRAFRNVAGNLFQREAQPIGGTRVRPGEDVPAAPERIDVELEKEVKERLARKNEDHFQRLGLPRDASSEQVKDAFLSLAKRFHPDRLSATGQTHLLPQVRDVFAKVKESYDALVEPAARARYLSELEEKDGGSRRTERDPEAARAAFLKAEAYLRRHDLMHAEAELVRAVALDTRAEYLAELAWTLYSAPKRREEAHEEIRALIARALKATPDHDRAYVVAAYIARVDGEHDKSEKLFRKALERNPRNVEAAREIRLIDSRKPPNGGGSPGSGFLGRFRKK